MEERTPLSRTVRIIFALSGAVGLILSLGSPVLLPYPVLVLAVLRGWRLPKMRSPGMALLFSTCLSALLLESSAWLDNFLKNEPEPALFHPQLIPDLIISVGVYSAWWLTWWLVLRRYHFTTSQVFITTGLYGVLIEQQGKVFLAGLAAMPAGILLWAFVAVAYGATMALAFHLARESFTAERDAAVKYLLAWGGLFLATLVTSLAWGSLLEALQIILPEKLPMRDYPLW